MAMSWPMTQLCNSLTRTHRQFGQLYNILHHSPRVRRLYSDVLAVELVPDVAVRGGHLAPVVPLGRGGRGAVSQEHPVLLVT